MADLTTKTFNEVVQDQAAAVQARASGLKDFSVGSILRAFAQAVASVAMWFQAIALQVLTLTRLSTSAGADADSWVADWAGPFEDGGEASFTRLAATWSTGELTLARFSTSGTALVPVGSTVETTDGSQRFVVALDEDHGDYDANLGGYVMGIGDASVDVPATSVTAGAASNVLAGTVTVITSPIVGVDTVENADAFVGGSDAETDEAMRVRWRRYVQGLREGTPAAVLAYVLALSPTVDAYLVENEELNGAERKGFFYVIADDGSGDPPPEFIATVSATVDAHRAAGIEGAAYAPEPVTITITGTVVDIADGADEDTVIEQVETALAQHILDLKIGDDVVFTRLYGVAYDAAPDLRKITLLLNGGTADVAVTSQEVADLTSVAVTG